MDDEKPVADGGARPTEPRLSRWAVASAVLCAATLCLAPFSSGSDAPTAQLLCMAAAIISGIIAGVRICLLRGKLRGIPYAVAGSIIALVVVSATPRFAKVRPATPAGTMRNDARWIASAAQQYLLEHQAESVAFVYDPATGEVGPPLDAYVTRLTTNYAPVPERLTKTGTFQLGHPKVGVLTFTAEGGELKPPRPARE